jgi:hypothetical protein
MHEVRATADRENALLCAVTPCWTRHVDFAKENYQASYMYFRYQAIRPLNNHIFSRLYSVRWTWLFQIKILGHSLRRWENKMSALGPCLLAKGLPISRASRSCNPTISTLEIAAATLFRVITTSLSQHNSVINDTTDPRAHNLNCDMAAKSRSRIIPDS